MRLDAPVSDFNGVASEKVILEALGAGGLCLLAFFNSYCFLISLKGVPVLRRVSSPEVGGLDGVGGGRGARGLSLRAWFSVWSFALIWLKDGFGGSGVASMPSG